MPLLPQLYRPSLALLTDLYQLTMANGYWKSGTADQEAAFHLFFRHNPFKGGYALAAGLEQVCELLANFRFEPDDLDYLATLNGADEAPLFERGFLDHLAQLRLTCDVDAVPEGTAVFPHEPLVRIVGPMVQAQLLETALLNIVNFQTLIATKTARICQAARGEPVLEFGLRRAQGVDGSLSASRAAFIGGCAATSNVLAGKLLGIPVKGTHAHSWVMSFDDELESFMAYAKAMPNNCVFLVDTFDTLEGVRKAVQAGQWLREQGKKLLGIRLDSGDLAYLSIEARKILDEAGFTDAAIVASNDLDEHLIANLKEQGAQISVWGVGTKLVTAFDQPALGGVYKLGAVRKSGGEWRHKIKLSEQRIKISNPGLLQVRRFTADGAFIGDLLYNEQSGCRQHVLIDPQDSNRQKAIPAGATHRDLLVPVLRTGKPVCEGPSLVEIRRHAAGELQHLSAGIKRFVNPHEYPVGLEPGLHELKNQLIRRARGLD